MPKALKLIVKDCISKDLLEAIEMRISEIYIDLQEEDEKINVNNKLPDLLLFYKNNEYMSELLMKIVYFNELMDSLIKFNNLEE